MVVNAHGSKPATGHFNPPRAYEPVNQNSCELHLAQELVVKSGTQENRRPDVKSEIGDDSEDDGSPIRPPQEIISQDTSTEVTEDDGSDVTTIFKSVSLDSATPSSKAILKSAFRCNSAGREGLHVHWAADVYDPTPSIACHTKGSKKRSPKPALVSRRARRHQNSKGGSHGKSKKQGKGDKAVSQQTSKVPVNAADVKNVETSPQGGAEPEAEGCEAGENLAQDMYSSGDTEMQTACDGSCGDHADICIPIKAVKVPEEEDPKLVGSPKKSKKRSKRGRSSASSIELSSACDDKLKSELEDVTLQRLAAANALASGQIDAARELLLTAVVAARSLNAVDEEARCLRLLADTQVEQEKSDSLLGAAKCFERTEMAYEHAEALLSLVQHQVHDLLEVSKHNSGLWYGSQTLDVASASALQLAKAHLQEAATRLLSSSSASNALLCAGVVKLDSPTGRRRKGKGQQFLSPELTAVTLVMGSICQAWGKVCFLLREFNEAYAQLFAASRNSLWCKDCPAGAQQVRELLEALSGKAVAPEKVRQACAVY